MTDEIPKLRRQITRVYYSARRPGVGSTRFDLRGLRTTLHQLYLDFEKCGYFYENLESTCVDDWGNSSPNIKAKVEMHIGYNLWPIETWSKNYSEHQCFDMIEFLFDNCSEPSSGWLHSHNQCGWHFSEFNQIKGREAFRTEVNKVLCSYESGFSLNLSGEICRLEEPELEVLLERPIPTNDAANISERISAARTKFRNARSGLSARRDAVRDLADVLEFIRPQLKSIMARDDENALFNIINNFAIRHHRSDQRYNYDESIWHSWMFHFYYATLQASLRMLDKADPN